MPLAWEPENLKVPHSSSAALSDLTVLLTLVKKKPPCGAITASEMYGTVVNNHQTVYTFLLFFY